MRGSTRISSDSDEPYRAVLLLKQDGKSVDGHACRVRLIVGAIAGSNHEVDDLTAVAAGNGRCYTAAVDGGAGKGSLSTIGIPGKERMVKSGMAEEFGGNDKTVRRDIDLPPDEMNRPVSSAVRRGYPCDCFPHNGASSNLLAQSIHTSREAAIRIADGTKNP